MLTLLVAEGWGWFQEGSFMGRILDEWFKDSEDFAGVKLPHMLVIASIAFLLIYLLRLVTTRMVITAERHAAGTARMAEIRTLTGVIRATGLAIIGLIAGMQMMDVLGVNLYPLLASAGVAGVALGLASQSLVKDMLNGVMILLEGHFTIGDRVSLAGVSGTVVAMTLRKTTLRAADNTIYVIPNSQITTVANLGYDVPLPTTQGESISINQATIKNDESGNPFA
jgi:small conductance mechanosensitive channel